MGSSLKSLELFEPQILMPKTIKKPGYFYVR